MTVLHAPGIEGFVGATTSLILNSLSAAWIPAKFLGLFVRRARAVDKALPEMRTGSDILIKLAQTTDPKTPYTLVIGNTSEFRKVPPSPTDPWYKRLGEAISISDLLHRVLSVAFLNEPNDIAVSVASGCKVDATRQPAPVIHELACDHLTYFSNPVSVRLLWRVLNIGSPAINS